MSHTDAPSLLNSHHLLLLLTFAQQIIVTAYLTILALIICEKQGRMLIRILTSVLKVTHMQGDNKIYKNNTLCLT